MPVQSNGFSFVKDHPHSSDHKSLNPNLLNTEAGEANFNITDSKTGMNDTINLEAYQAYYNTNENNLNKSMPNDTFAKSSGTSSKVNIDKRNSCD
jgi:hypothetical protein